MDRAIRTFLSKSNLSSNQGQLTPKWHDEKNLSLSKPEAWGIGDEEKTAIGVFKEGQMLHSL